MLTTEREKKICEKYSKRDADYKVHCYECPLNKGGLYCKAKHVFLQRAAGQRVAPDAPACEMSLQKKQFAV